MASVVTPPAGNAGAAPPEAPDTLTAVQDVAHVRPLVTRIVHQSAQKTYTVAAGDTLSGIAGQFCGSPGKWPSLNHGNHAGIKDPDLIFPGQKILLTCSDPALMAAPAAVSPVQAAPVRHDRFDGGHGQCGDGDGDGLDAPCSAIFPQESSDPAPESAPVQATAAVTGVGGTYHGSGSMQSCIIARESGGNSQVMNSSGHYGLYQFSESTWIASGGSASTFGHASVAEQNAVFQAAVAARGYSDWTPYDGCL